MAATARSLVDLGTPSRPTPAGTGWETAPVIDDGTEIALAGGVGNAGAVVRVGDTVRRPATRYSPLVRRIVQHLEAVGFDRAQRWLGTDEHGRDVYTFVEGEVPLPPFPRWAQEPAVLGEVAGLLRDFHQAMAGFDAGTDFSDELADPEGGPVLCHDDVCPENVVFRDGRAVALLDFDLAAPGRRTWDLARTARMWVPVAGPRDALTWPPDLDVHHRLGLFTRAYGLDADEREGFVDVLLAAVDQGRHWVRRKVDAGEPAFVAMWHDFAMERRWAIDEAWLAEHRESLARAVAAAG